ncbi:MAG: ChaN family lipoprotein [Desulfohalobiaceae bacterium]|nr:ChaN family lipoprotein [Desulfohalobiaceae bacterium]
MKNQKHFPFFFFLAGFLGLAVTGCTQKAHPPIHPVAPATAKIKGSPAEFRPGRIIDLASGQAIAFSDLINRLQAKDLVFIGEVHDHAEHHLIQVQILQRLLNDRPRSAVGIEFLPHTAQPAVDRYLDREITESAFLEQAGWKDNWGFPFHLYRPIFHLIREQGQALSALNAPHEVVRKVARKGLSGLKAKERRLLAKSINLDNEQHRAYVREAFENQAHGQLKNFGYFYQAQCAWEETMAEIIAACRQPQAAKMVVLSGNGHIIYKFGIPDRVQRRVETDLATLLLKPLNDSLIIDPKEADFVWLTGN